tara:strand:- start:5766 stop:6383 length:618 start_codon:yes stop_codon:yes gene_type:complete
MDVYFVRHGQTDGNVAGRHQAETSELTSLGKQQAREVSKLLAEFKPTHLITSSHVRAIQTTQIISEEIGLLPETSPLFTELHRPKSLYGHYHFSITSFWFVIRWYLGQIGGDTLSDEGESYANLRKRIKEAKNYIETLPEDSKVIVVSHALFISMFLAHVCQDKPLGLWQAVKYWTRLHQLKNTAVKHLRVAKVDNGCGWELQNN